MAGKKMTLETLDAFMEENNKLIHPSTYEALAAAVGLPIDKVQSATEKFEELKKNLFYFIKERKDGNCGSN